MARIDPRYPEDGQTPPSSPFPPFPAPHPYPREVLPPPSPSVGGQIPHQRQEEHKFARRGEGCSYLSSGDCYLPAIWPILTITCDGDYRPPGVATPSLISLNLYYFKSLSCVIKKANYFGN